MRIHMVFVGISIAMLFGAINSPGFAEKKSSDWIAIEENVHSKEVLNASWKEFEKSDLFLSFVFPDQASIEILKPFNRIEPKA
ncbi:MAG: hypothetical protein KIT34_10170, partial [Cyanobacteria bacterium TGS_CYA1]|nr:hypothetical protein [Cyanobacteria bacterium TGS_CYA1]